jgi:putative DNA primase/helicase
VSEPNAEAVDFIGPEPPWLSKFPLTDLGNAERLVASAKSELRYAPGLGWFAWDGRRWRRDADGAAMRAAAQSVRALFDEALGLDPDQRKKLVQFALASESEPRLRAAVKLAETQLPMIVEPRQLDAQPMLFNAANGTIELESGQLREHRREDLLTRITPVSYEPGVRAQLWEASLRRATGSDPELAAFLKRAFGYSLTGYVSEDKLFFAHGPTATAKSSMLEAIKQALGEYAMTADFETFLKRRGEAGIRNDVARLNGARLVVSVEVDEGKALAEGLLKQLTGGDAVAARFLYRETFEFYPVLKLWLVANARPRVNAEDDAMWRRIVQVPFTEVIPETERDERVKLRLRNDPGVQAAILAWAVEGCLEWQQSGLLIPERVRAYTADYRAENDQVGEWLDDCCALESVAWTSVGDLRRSYESWCETSGERPLGAKKFGAILEAKGYTARKSPAGDRGRAGLRVR